MTTELDKLKTAITQAKQKQDKQTKKHPKQHNHHPLRSAGEMVAALAVSVFIGVQLDATFATKPVFLIIFFILGSLAGMLTIWKHHAKTKR